MDVCTKGWHWKGENTSNLYKLLYACDLHIHFKSKWIILFYHNTKKENCRLMWNKFQNGKSNACG